MTNEMNEALKESRDAPKLDNHEEAILPHRSEDPEPDEDDDSEAVVEETQREDNQIAFTGDRNGDMVQGDEYELATIKDEEQLKKELQDLLDSQLEDTSKDTHPVTSDRNTVDMQVHDEESPTSNKSSNADQEPKEPHKGFTEDEITAFMNNQIKKHHQFEMEQQLEQSYMDNQQTPQPGTQQHLILVTQNGDRIILIQNPSEAGREENEGEVGDNSSEAPESAIYQPTIDIDEQEEFEIQAQHKRRQQMLMMHMDTLRKRQKKNDEFSEASKDPINVSQEENNCSEQGAQDWWNEKSGDMGNKLLGNSLDGAYIENSESRKQMNDTVKPVTRRGRSSSRAYRVPKWLSNIGCYLSKCYDYTTKKRETVDQLSKFFPSASQSFESRCQELKADLLKVELSVGRFQNVVTNDFESIEKKIRSFVKDYHLEAFATEEDEDDEVPGLEYSIDDENREGYERNKVNNPLLNKSGSIVIKNSKNSNMELITPAGVTITAAAHMETYLDDKNELKHSLEPEPEIRDFEMDSSLQTNDVCPYDFVDELSRSIPITQSKIKPTVTVRKAHFRHKSPQRSDHYPSFYTSATKRVSNQRLTRASIEKKSGFGKTLPFKCNYQECNRSFSTKLALFAHQRTHKRGRSRLETHSKSRYEARSLRSGSLRDKGNKTEEANDDNSDSNDQHEVENIVSYLSEWPACNR